MMDHQTCWPFFLLLTAFISVSHGFQQQQQQPTAAQQVQCPGFLPEEVSYPTPYISAGDRSARCKSLFPRYNSTGTANLNFVGQNTYHNPCKIECGLCVDDELPSEEEAAAVVIRSYPPHISLKDSVVRCVDEVEIFEQYMADGIRCGPFHICQSKCCTAKPEMFPHSKRARQRLRQQAAADVNRPSQDIPAEWTKPLDCPEEGYYRNPNDCHKFYRCHLTGTRAGFARTLFECNPPTLVFDEQFKVCVPIEENINENICEALAADTSADY